MPLLAESLVDEWLNRQGFFTVRGIRDGVDEIDLLGVRPTPTGLQAWHVEVQVSFRPIGYITKMTEEIATQKGARSRSAVSRRTDSELSECVSAWVEHKFKKDRKVAARERCWSTLSWEFHLIHGVAKFPNELDLIAAHGVTITPLHSVLRDLCVRTPGSTQGAAGTDLSEMINYFQNHQ